MELNGDSSCHLTSFASFLDWNLSVLRLWSLLEGEKKRVKRKKTKPWLFTGRDALDRARPPCVLTSASRPFVIIMTNGERLITLSFYMGAISLPKGCTRPTRRAIPWEPDTEIWGLEIFKERERWWALNADKNYHTHVPVVQEMLEISKQTSQKGEFLLYLVSWNFDGEPCIWPHQNLWAMNEAVPLQNEILSQ